MRWKVFRIANYIQLILTVLLLGILSFSYFTDGDNEFISWVMLFFFSLAVIIVNNCFNLHLLQQYFPARILPEGKSRMFTVLLILFIFVIIGLIIICTLGLISELSTTGNNDRAGLVGLGILMVELLLGIYILVIQAGLPLFIERNNRKEMQNALDRLGQPEN